jgi:hypothetical protein
MRVTTQREVSAPSIGRSGAAEASARGEPRPPQPCPRGAKLQSKRSSPHRRQGERKLFVRLSDSLVTGILWRNKKHCFLLPEG